MCRGMFGQPVRMTIRLSVEIVCRGGRGVPPGICSGFVNRAKVRERRLRMCFSNELVCVRASRRTAGTAVARSWTDSGARGCMPGGGWISEAARIPVRTGAAGLLPESGGAEAVSSAGFSVPAASPPPPFCITAGDIWIIRTMIGTSANIALPDVAALGQGGACLVVPNIGEPEIGR